MMTKYVSLPVEFVAERNEGPHAGTVAGKNWPVSHYRMTYANPDVPMEQFVVSPAQLACYYDLVPEQPMAPPEAPEKPKAPAFNVPPGRASRLDGNGNDNGNDSESPGENN